MQQRIINRVEGDRHYSGKCELFLYFVVHIMCITTLTVYPYAIQNIYKAIGQKSLMVLVQVQLSSQQEVLLVMSMQSALLASLLVVAQLA